MASNPDRVVHPAFTRDRISKYDFKNGARFTCVSRPETEMYIVDGHFVRDTETLWRVFRGHYDYMGINVREDKIGYYDKKVTISHDIDAEINYENKTCDKFVKNYRLHNNLKDIYMDQKVFVNYKNRSLGVNEDDLKNGDVYTVVKKENFNDRDEIIIDFYMAEFKEPVTMNQQYGTLSGENIYVVREITKKYYLFDLIGIRNEKYRYFDNPTDMLSYMKAVSDGNPVLKNLDHLKNDHPPYPKTFNFDRVFGLINLNQ